jgi:hypothetical protein
MGCLLKRAIHKDSDSINYKNKNIPKSGKSVVDLKKGECNTLLGYLALKRVKKCLAQTPSVYRKKAPLQKGSTREASPGEREANNKWG